MSAKTIYSKTDELHCVTVEPNNEQLRKQHPSGWLRATAPESRALLIDALLEIPPAREFTADELAEKTGVPPETVQTHVETLLGWGVINRSGTTPVQYSVVEESHILQQIVRLNSVVSRVESGELPERKANAPEETDRRENVGSNETESVDRAGSTES